MPEYIIHIGPPKAGSKYLQSAMAKLADEMALSGICYPTRQFSTIPRISHHFLVERLQAGPSQALEDEFRKLNESDSRFVVFSCEGFFALTEEQLLYLRKLVADAPVHIVYYCRRWSERIPSLWAQDVQMGRAATLLERYVVSVRTPAKSRDLNPSLIWDKFASVFGRDSINLVSFNNLVDAKVDLLDHFLGRFLGWKAPTRPTDIFENRSPDTIDTEIIRALNAVHIQMTGEITHDTRKAFFELKESLNLDLLSEAIKRHLTLLPIDDNAAAFADIFNRMQEYSDRLVNPLRGVELFRRKVNNRPYARPDYLLEPDAANEVARIYAAIKSAKAVKAKPQMTRVATPAA